VRDCTRPSPLAVQQTMANIMDALGDDRRLVLAAPQDQPGQQPVMLSQEMLVQGDLRLAPTITSKAAHIILNRLRLEIDVEDQDSFDMTMWELFDWKRYIAQRPQDAAVIIGCGITKFEFRYLHVLDSNTKQRRSDFVVHRADGSGTRLHPTSSGKVCLDTGLREAYPVHGRLLVWIPALAAPQGCRDDEIDWTSHLAQTVSWHPVAAPEFAHSVSQADLRGRHEAYKFLQQWVRDYDPQTRFWVSLKAETWPWPFFVANEPLAGHFREDPVSQFGVTWKAGDRNEAVFWGETLNGRPFHLTIAGNRPTRVHWNWDDLEWN
jgi:hypothetical protein